ncbi:MAG: hypothetical protein ACYTEQ_21895 [Planctomycetota bacterium]|jgi:hypothetical protein
MKSVTEKRWLLPAFAAVILLCVFLAGGRFGAPENAQAALPPAGDAGILVVPVQITRDSYGLAMVDTTAQTLWVYEVNSRGPAFNRLRLLAARSWRYDRLLQQYNTGEPTPEQVKTLVENLGRLPQERVPGIPPTSGPDILRMAEPDNKGHVGIREE